MFPPWMSVRLCHLNSGSQRVSRALRAARPSYLSSAISMWMLQLFGCGIFPHTGSHQSRLTGHWLHSITERPGLEKKKYSQATDVQPETMHYTHPPPPSRSTLFSTQQENAVSSSPRDEQECAVTALYSGGPIAYSLQEQHYTTCKKAKPIPSELTGKHKRLTNHLRTNQLAHRTDWMKDAHIWRLSSHIIYISY